MKKERYTPEEADYTFGGTNTVSEDFRIILAKALSKLPRKIVDWAAENLNFLSSTPDLAYTTTIKEWKHKKGFVFLCEPLKNRTEEEQTFYIAHEIAHLKLEHRSPIFSYLTEEETQKQEEEADELAKKWLS
mgnify:CR=1 FL=1